MTGDQQTPLEYTRGHWRKQRLTQTIGEPGNQQRQVEKNTYYWRPPRISTNQYRPLKTSRDQWRLANTFWRSADTTKEHQIPLVAYRLELFETCRDLQRSLTTSSRDHRNQQRPLKTTGDQERWLETSRRHSSTPEATGESKDQHRQLESLETSRDKWRRTQTTEDHHESPQINTGHWRPAETTEDHWKLLKTTRHNHRPLQAYRVYWTSIDQ